MTTTKSDGLYACYHLTPEAENHLHAFVTRVFPEGIELQPSDKYHITTVYSRAPVNYTGADAEAIGVTPIGFEYLGREGDDPIS